MRECTIDVLPKCDHTDEHVHMIVLCDLDDISLMIKDGIVENFVHEVKILISGLLPLLY